MTLTYTEEDLLTPEGSNELSPESLFFQRALYKNKIYPTNVPAPLDTWYHKALFGRVDLNQNTVAPKPAKLRRIQQAISPNLQALSFVTYMFEDLVGHLQIANVTSRLFTGGTAAMINLKAVQAYSPPDLKYGYYKQSLIDAYINALPEDRNEQIIDFRSFCEDFLPYVLFMAETYPVTRTNFLLGNYVSPFISGLSIAISLDPADKDEVKYQKFLQDVNYPFYARAAKKFGFLVNKNMPWVLTADLFSSVVLERLSMWVNEDGTPMGRAGFFGEWYNTTYTTDIPDLIDLFTEGYKTLLNRNLYYQNKTILCDDELKIRILSRAPYSEEDASAVLSPNFLINLYVNLRQKESKDSLSPTEVGQIKRKAILLYRSTQGPADLRYMNAAAHINSIYREYIYSRSSLRPLVSQIKLDRAPTPSYTTEEDDLMYNPAEDEEIVADTDAEITGYDNY
jgi:hypothetical protein